MGITGDDKAQADRATTGSFGGRTTAGRTVPIVCAATTLASRGVSNPNKSLKAQNPHAVRLGAEIGLDVMERVEWERYVTTSTTVMSQGDTSHFLKVIHEIWQKGDVRARDGYSMMQPIPKQG